MSTADDDDDDDDSIDGDKDCDHDDDVACYKRYYKKPLIKWTKLGHVVVSSSRSVYTVEPL